MTERVVHYSRVLDDSESINPVTGRSIYYAQRPWRCDDRVTDLLGSVIKMQPITSIANCYAVMRRCAKSDVGAEPISDYNVLGKREVMFYVDRARSNMLRRRFFEVYPYDPYAVSRLQQEDGLRMRVWRRQREMELKEKDAAEAEKIPDK